MYLYMSVYSVYHSSLHIYRAALWQPIACSNDLGL